MLVPTAIFAAIILAIFWRAWTPLASERRAFAWDPQWEYWGDIQFEADALRDRELPLWNPHDRLGHPFYADPQADLLYPPQWGLVGAAAIAGSTPWWLVSIKILFHFELAALGTFALLRRRKLPTIACYLGAISVITSYAMLQNSPSALNWSFAWIPWWLCAVDAWIESPTRKRGLLVGITAALCALAGAWAAFWYGLLVVGPLAVVGIVTGARALPADARKTYTRAILVTGAIAIGLFAILAGPQIAATIGLVGDTVRDERGVSFFGTTVFDAVDLFGFFMPRAQGENVYLGFAPILWMSILVAFRPDARKLTLVAIIGIAILCAMGDRGPALPALASVITPFGLFRRAHRYLYVMVLPVGILTAEGFAYLLALRDEAELNAEVRLRLRRGVALVAAMAIVVFGVGFVVNVKSPWKPDVLRDAFAWGMSAALIGGASTWLLLAHPRLRWLPTIVAMIVGVDLWVARSQKVENDFQPVPTTKHDADVRALPDVPQPHRIYDRGHIGYRSGIRLGVRDLGGYEGDPLALQRFARVRDDVKRSPKLAAHVGVAYGFDDLSEPFSHGNSEGVTSAGSGMWRVANPVADVRWYPGAQIVDDAAAAWKAITAKPPGSIAVVEHPSADLAARLTHDAATAPAVAPTPTDNGVDGRVTASTRNSLTAEIDAPADGIVVINEMFYRRGWSATVDGVATPILAANGFARGLVVGPGHHVIHMQFQVLGFVAAAAIAVLAWFALLFGWLAACWRTRLRESD